MGDTPVTFEELLSRVPSTLDSGPVMMALNEPVTLATGSMTLSRGGKVIADLDGALRLTWLPNLDLRVNGTASIDPKEFGHDEPLELGIPSIKFSGRALFTSLTYGSPSELGLLVEGARSSTIRPTESFRFYLVRFPDCLGELVKYGDPGREGIARDRLALRNGTITCFVDAIEKVKPLQKEADRTASYLITHVGEVRFLDGSKSTDQINEVLDGLYWLFGFLRGARTGPILPHVSPSIEKGWIALVPWIIDEPRKVSTWLPDRSPLALDDLFGGFLGRWNDSRWNDGLRLALSWYFAANAPSASSEVRIPLSQIALDLLASLHGYEGGAAHDRIRALLSHCRIPLDIPPHLSELATFARAQALDVSECLTRIRNKLEHPTDKNRSQMSAIDGLLRMQASQLGLQLLELVLLASFGYRGKYARRAFRGWKGNDEVQVPWA